MKPYVYIVICIVNDKVYVGKGSAENPEEDTFYLGSGIALRNAIKKYGRSSFRKEIIAVFEEGEEELAFELERQIVNEDFVKDDSNYNLTTGGCGFDADKARAAGNKAWEKEGFREFRINFMRTLWKDPEYRKVMSSHIRKRWQEDNEYRNKMTKVNSEARKNDWKNPDYREKMRNHTSHQMKTQWADPEWREKRTRQLMKQTKGKIWVCNSVTGKCKMIWPDQFEEFQRLGYKKGRK
jgi:hypothetical protein